MSALKNRERLGTSLPIALVERLKSYSEKTMVPISKIIEKAIDTYLRNMESG
jgi:predicted DNA-binding protein